MPSRHRKGKRPAFFVAQYGFVKGERGDAFFVLPPVIRLVNGTAPFRINPTAESARRQPVNPFWRRKLFHDFMFCFYHLLCSTPACYIEYEKDSSGPRQINIIIEETGVACAEQRRNIAVRRQSHMKILKNSAAPGCGMKCRVSGSIFCGYALAIVIVVVSGRGEIHRMEFKKR